MWLRENYCTVVKLSAQDDASVKFLGFLKNQTIGFVRNSLPSRQSFNVLVLFNPKRSSSTTNLHFPEDLPAIPLCPLFETAKGEKKNVEIHERVRNASSTERKFKR